MDLTNLSILIQLTQKVQVVGNLRLRVSVGIGLLLQQSWPSPIPTRFRARLAGESG
jgi:hypothetical protein